MEKQIARAEKLVEKNVEGKRAKFLKLKKQREKKEVLYEVNDALIEKTKLLLGIKGYYTNLIDETDTTIIAHYHSLWHVEKAFRMAKSDLEARPIFHHKRESIEVHILIVFVSLCMAKAIEMVTNLSIKKVKEMIWKILDIEFIDTFTNRAFKRRMVTRGNEMVRPLSTLEQKTSAY